MARDFADRPVDVSLLTSILDTARRAPSAGHTAATEFVVLTGADRNRYWNLTLPKPRRDRFTFPRLPAAGALILVLTDPSLYVDRYSEPDKERTGLGADINAWSVPFWWVDAGAVVQNILLQAVEHELGACLFGVFDHEPAVKLELNIPDHKRIVAAIALGHESQLQGHPGRSAGRPRRPADAIIHWQGWTQADEEHRQSQKPTQQ